MTIIELINIAKHQTALYNKMNNEQIDCFLSHINDELVKDNLEGLIELRNLCDLVIDKLSIDKYNKAYLAKKK